MHLVMNNMEVIFCDGRQLSHTDFDMMEHYGNRLEQPFESEEELLCLINDFGVDFALMLHGTCIEIDRRTLRRYR